MRIENELLNTKEKAWINALLIVDFKAKNGLINQINGAEIEREYAKFYISIKFGVPKDLKPVELIVRVPVEMRVYRLDSVPIQFLLHVVNGYVSELEVFRADSGEVDDDIKLEKIEIILADELRTQSN